MKKCRLLLILASVMILAGMILFGVTMSMNGWDFSRLNTVNFVEETYELNGEISDILVVTDTADIVIAPADGEKTRIVVYEKENMRHTVTVKDGVLSINRENQRKWEDYIAFTVESPKISLYVPEGVYGRIQINASTGDVSIESITAQELTVLLSTGDITLQKCVCTREIRLEATTGRMNVTETECADFVSDASTGSIELTNMIAGGKISIERTTGDVRLILSDAEDISVKTSTGDISGILLTGKQFDAKTSTGEIRIPYSESGGKCVMETTTGDIVIEIQK